MASAFDPELLPPLARRTAFLRRARRVQPDYFTPEYHPLWPLAAITLFLIGVGLAIYTGLLVSVGGTLALKFVGFPIGIFAVLILWLLPDVDRPEQPPYLKLITAYFILMLWPNYIAIVLPGLPWITPPRVMLAVLLIVMLVHLPQSGIARRDVLGLLKWDRPAFLMYMGYLSLVVLTVPVSRDPASTLTYALLQETLALAPMVVAAILFSSDPKSVPQVIRVMTFAAVATMVIGVVEIAMQMPPWLDFIPPFMTIDPEVVGVVYSPQARVGDWRYRMRSTFQVVLYYTQYLNLVVPLVLYAAWRAKGRWRFMAWLLVPLVLHTVWFTNARTSFIAMFLSVFGILGMVLLRLAFFRNKGDPMPRNLMAVFAVLAIIGLGGAIASSHRLQMYTIGGSQHAASNATRDVQWSTTWEHLKKNQFGVGLGNSLKYVGNVKPGGTRVIDSLWINQLVDVGILGFLFYFGFYLRIAWVGMWTFLRAESEDEELAGIMGLGVFNYVVACYVVSNTDNSYVAMVLSVGVLALARMQQRRRTGEEVVALPATPMPVGGGALVLR